MNGSRKFIVISTTIAILLIVLVSISLAYAGRDNTLMKDKDLNLEINGFGLELPLSENGAIYDPVCLSSLSNNRITLNNDPGAIVSIYGKTIKVGSTINLELESLSENQLIPIDVKNEKDHRIIYLRSISSELPKLTAVGESLYEGNYYTSLGGGKTGLYEINPQGELVFYLAKSSVSPSNEAYADFQKHILEDGSIRYSYQRLLNTDQNERSGERIILDENHQYLKTITLKKSKNAKENEVLTVPAFILINDNHWIIGSEQLILAQNIPTELAASVTKIKRVLIQEVVDNEVVHEFTSDSFPELYALNETVYNDNLDQGIDYTGFNGMILDPKDENIIVSFKNMNTLLKIDLEKQAIIWKLSGAQDNFGLSSEQKITKATSFSLSDELIVFDQGQPDGLNRILKMELDEPNQKIISFEEILLSSGRSLADGNAQKIGDVLSIYSIGWGKKENGNTAISEIDFNTGKLLFEITLPEGNHFNGLRKSIEKEDK